MGPFALWSPPRLINQKLDGQSDIAAPAANLQQNLSYGLKYLPGPAPYRPGWLEQPASTSCKRRWKSLVSIARTKVSTTAAIVAASPGVIAPPASAEVTAFIAPAMSAALSIGGRANFTVRLRHGGRIRSRQSRIAVSDEREFHGLAGQGLGFALEQRHRGNGCGNQSGGGWGCPTGPFRRAARAPAVFAVICSGISTSDTSFVRAAAHSRSCCRAER